MFQSLWLRSLLPCVSDEVFTFYFITFDFHSIRDVYAPAGVCAYVCVFSVWLSDGT